MFGNFISDFKNIIVCECSGTLPITSGILLLASARNIVGELRSIVTSQFQDFCWSSGILFHISAEKLYKISVSLFHISVGKLDKISGTLFHISVRKLYTISGTLFLLAITVEGGPRK